MELKDKLTVLHKDMVIKELVYLTSTCTQHLFFQERELVSPPESAVLWVGDIGAISFVPIKKKHNFVEVSSNIWKLNIENIEIGDL